MSINLDQTNTLYEKIDAVSNFVQQMLLAHSIKDENHFKETHRKVTDLLFEAMRQAEDMGLDANSDSDRNFKESILSVGIKDDKVSIEIGISALCYAIKAGPVIDYLYEDPDEFEITDEDIFAQEVVTALHREEEDGTTPVHRLFDKAAEAAIENGCDGIKYPD